MKIDTFETLRLKARKLSSEDYRFLRELHSDPVTMETLGGIRNEGESLDNLNWNLKQWKEYGIGLWLFFEKATNQFVGTVGLRHLEIEDILEVDLAYALLSKYWQLGYATEMSKSCIEIGLKEFKFNSIVAGTRNTNLASQKVIEKLGFTYERTIHKFGHFQKVYRLIG